MLRHCIRSRGVSCKNILSTSRDKITCICPLKLRCNCSFVLLNCLLWRFDNDNKLLSCEMNNSEECCWAMGPVEGSAINRERRMYKCVVLEEISNQAIYGSTSLPRQSQWKMHVHYCLKIEVAHIFGENNHCKLASFGTENWTSHSHELCPLLQADLSLSLLCFNVCSIREWQSIWAILFSVVIGSQLSLNWEAQRSQPHWSRRDLNTHYFPYL